MMYYGREHEEENRRKKRTRQKTEAPTMAVRSALKQPEKNAQRNPGKKGRTYYYCGKEGHLKRDGPQASKPPPGSMSSLQRITLEKRLPSEVYAPGIGLSRQSG